MSDEEVLELLREALGLVAPERRDEFRALSLDQTIAELRLDSVSTLEMLGCLEDQLGATFPDDRLAEVKDLRQLAFLIRGQHHVLSVLEERAHI